MTAVLSYHQYRYYPYEKDLAAREVAKLLGTDKFREMDGVLEVCGGSPNKADRLTYFSKVRYDRTEIETVQSQLEKAATGQKRQATRYSVHGLHEYKGKFNPQVAKALLNICGVDPGSKVLDPFCGSGTTLVEATQLGCSAVGYDINPFAVCLANAKLKALRMSAEHLQSAAEQVAIEASRQKSTIFDGDHERHEYLNKWFEPEKFEQIESLKWAIELQDGDVASILKVLASNILREHSLQDPKDLRIRRRKSSTPSHSVIDDFIRESAKFIERLKSSQQVLGAVQGAGEAHLRDISNQNLHSEIQFDAALTSPPYAMALPYIDTQRLSLVWLGLETPKQINTLEASLIGSREFRRNSRSEYEALLQENREQLPIEQAQFCLEALAAIGESDGFRRRAVPALLYRYFVSMKYSFQSVLNELRPNAPYMLIVGHNHTVLGGKRIDIDTPSHLASIAREVGWHLEEIVPLQTYQRWGYHAGNAVAAESLIMLRRP
ncbi:RNA methylase (plasmid) [Roseibium aggregatum]|uniref:TRM11 family SAM-dependent methyltransferase n=1 Tax=Roseibium aggregatum TaxID=187304 RepID=UPI001E35811C|nr:class I SAM-dependent methyltransferase [Roseibium aggregatum]UES60232.1 RNA methylase [Roseibium aggregatum]